MSEGKRMMTRADFETAWGRQIESEDGQLYLEHTVLSLFGSKLPWVCWKCFCYFPCNDDVYQTAPITMMDINSLARGLGGTETVHSIRPCCVEKILDDDEKVSEDEISRMSTRVAGAARTANRRGVTPCGGRNCQSVYLNPSIMTSEGSFRGDFYAAFICRNCSTSFLTNP